MLICFFLAFLLDTLKHYDIKSFISRVFLYTNTESCHIHSVRDRDRAEEKEEEEIS